MLPHYLVKNNPSDAACRTVDNIQPALSRATHLLLGITGEDYYNYG